jgi:hypothetical protein
LADGERQPIMTPGPTVIRRCSACSKLIAQHTIASGNTFGAKLWTDGKRRAPMLPEQPWLVKCGHCSALVWIDEQEKLGTASPWKDTAGAFAGALAYLTPVTSDYERLSRDPTQAPEKQRYLRQCFWWAGNDARRGSSDPAPFSEAERQNLESFAGMLDEASDQDRLCKAEALRELGRFEEAMRLLAQDIDPRMKRAATFIRDLAMKGDPQLKEFPST